VALLDVRAEEYTSSSLAACLNWARIRYLRADERNLLSRLGSGLTRGRGVTRLLGVLRGRVDSITLLTLFEVSASIILLSSSHSVGFSCRLGGVISTLEVVSLVSITTARLKLVALLARGAANTFNFVARMMLSVATAFTSKPSSRPAVAKSVSAFRVLVVNSSPFDVFSSR